MAEVPSFFLTPYIYMYMLPLRSFLLFCMLGLSLQLRGQTLLPAPSPDVMAREVRAVWLTTYSGLDWPRRPARTEAEAARQRRELLAMLDGLQAAGINTVLFQARTRSTVTYRSDIEPWDGVLTGHAGEAPLYDPLAFAVDECHRRGMELHAWVVAFPICKAATARALGRRALPRLHPELCQLCGDAWMMDPGVPGTAPYLAALCAEITRRYDVDGIHLDYIRYPEHSIPFDDRATYRRYGQGRDKAQWRRDNVTRCVRAVHDSVKALKPWVKLSCSPVGKYADLPRQSSHGWNARDAVSQDAKLWLREGWMDLLLPMMYFDGQHYYPFLVDWTEDTEGRPVVPGLGIYFLNDRERGWPLSVVRRQMNATRLSPTGGQAYFRARFLLDNEKGLYDYMAGDFYRIHVLPPALDGDTRPVHSPRQPRSHRTGYALQLSWQANPAPPAAAFTRPDRYNVYRCPCDSFRADSAVRIATYLTAPEYHYRPALPKRLDEYFYVTAIDAYGRESQPVRCEEQN